MSNLEASLLTGMLEDSRIWNKIENAYTDHVAINGFTVNEKPNSNEKNITVDRDVKKLETVRHQVKMNDEQIGDMAAFGINPDDEIRSMLVNNAIADITYDIFDGVDEDVIDDMFNASVTQRKRRICKKISNRGNLFDRLLMRIFPAITRLSLLTKVDVYEFLYNDSSAFHIMFSIVMSKSNMSIKKQLYNRDLVIVIPAEIAPALSNNPGFKYLSLTNHVASSPQYLEQIGTIYDTYEVYSDATPDAKLRILSKPNLYINKDNVKFEKLVNSIKNETIYRLSTDYVVDVPINFRLL